MINKVFLDNFKSFDHAELELGQVTIFIGPNGTGKSSVAQALMMLRQSIGSNGLVTDGPLINLGTFFDILKRDSAEKSVSIGLTKELEGYSDYGLADGASLYYKASFNPKLVAVESQVGTDANPVINISVTPDKASITPNVYKSSLRSGHYANSPISPTRDITIPFILGHLSFYPPSIEQKAKVFHKALLSLSKEIYEEIQNAYLVPALRGLEKPDYFLGNTFNLDIPPGDNPSLATTFGYSEKEVTEKVASWSEKITGSRVERQIVPDKKVAIKSYIVEGGIPVITDGSGINQLVHLLLILAATPDNSVLFIEEPEIHLHPKAQTELCGIMLEEILNSKRQLIISTHSEHVLYSFAQAVRDGKISKGQLSIYVFKSRDEQPEKVEQDESGDLYYEWGKQFFNYPQAQ